MLSADKEFFVHQYGYAGEGRACYLLGPTAVQFYIHTLESFDNGSFKVTIGW